MGRQSSKSSCGAAGNLPRLRASVGAGHTVAPRDRIGAVSRVTGHILTDEAGSTCLTNQAGCMNLQDAESLIWSLLAARGGVAQVPIRQTRLIPRLRLRF